MSSYGAQVLPRLFASLTAPVEQVQIKCLYALNCFCDQLGDDIIPYLEPMMQQLSHMLQTGNQQIKENTVLAIAAAAVAAGKVCGCMCGCGVFWHNGIELVLTSVTRAYDGAKSIILSSRGGFGVRRSSQVASVS